MDLQFSVLMTVYGKEMPDSFSLSLKSILVDQTILPDQFVLVCDGPLTEELDAVIELYRNEYCHQFDIIRLSENVGQGKASQVGLMKCRYELIARMDSDDIAEKDRFEQQLSVFRQQKNIGVVGGFIAEFKDDPNVITGIRTTPEEHPQIAALFKKRNPVNNVTVMYRKSDIIEIGGYSEFRMNEDFNLYVRLLLAGKEFYNIQNVLVRVRTGNNMIARRRDINIYKAWKQNQRLLYEGHVTSLFDYRISCLKCYMFIRSPGIVKRMLYKTVLRKKVVTEV